MQLVFVLRKSGDVASISTILRYDPQTNVTGGVFYIHTSSIRPDYFKKMPDQFINCSHPLLLPLLAIELTLDAKVNHLTRYAGELIAIENRTGYGVNPLRGESNLPSDYRALVRKLGLAHSKLYLALAAIAGSRLSIQFIRQKLHHIHQFLPEESQRKLNFPCQMLDERIEFLLSNTEYLLVLGGLKEQMEAQQTVVSMPGLHSLSQAKTLQRELTQ